MTVSAFRPSFLFGPAPAAPAPAVATPRLFTAPTMSRDSFTASAAAAPVDGSAPDPVKLRQAILAYRDAIVAADAKNAGTEARVFAGLFAGGPIALLPGLMNPHGINLLTLAWLGREATPMERVRYDAMIKADVRTGLAATVREIADRGTLARLPRTDGSPAAVAAIGAQVAAMLRWQPGDALGQADNAIPPIPAGPALDPVRAAAAPAPASVGKPNTDRANSDAAKSALRQAIADYGAAIDESGRRNSDMMVSILSGRLANAQVFLLPGLMLPHGAKMLMLAWLGREPNAEETARWTAWQTERGWRTAFADILKDIESVGMLARLPETDGSAEAVAAMKKEVGARLTWR